MTYRIRVTMELITDAEPDERGCLSQEQAFALYGECRTHGDEVASEIVPMEPQKTLEAK